MKLTERSVAALRAPADKDDIVFWDDDLPGFGVRVRGGSKRWICQYRANGIQRREILGDVRKVRLEMARKAARQRFARVELGEDPGAAKKAAREAEAVAKLTLANVSDHYLDSRQASKRPMRPSSYRDVKRYFSLHWAPLRNRPVAEITKAQVAAELQDITRQRGPIAAARARDALSAMFGWAMREGLAEANPVINTNDPGAGHLPRDRVLSATELAVIWRACGDDDFGKIVKLLMLTGCRRTEIGGLRWPEIDFDDGTITISANRSKNHRALTLTLPSVALDILQSVPQWEGRDALFGTNERGFTVWSTATAELKARIGEPLAPFVLHDIRRSVATHMAESPPKGLGIQPHIIEAILNHVGGHKAGVAGIYNRATYDPEKRQALALWADHLMAVIEGREPKVVSLRSA
jgi:integrase